MNSDFVGRTSAALGVRRRDMVEKDMLLHQILTDLLNIIAMKLQKNILQSF